MVDQNDQIAENFDAFIQRLIDHDCCPAYMYKVELKANSRRHRNWPAVFLPVYMRKTTPIARFSAFPLLHNEALPAQVCPHCGATGR